MAVEIYEGPDIDPGSVKEHLYDLYYFAVGFSEMSNYDIIDSDGGSGGAARYQGDPIADAQWTDPSTDVGDNAWIIVEQADPQKNPGTPFQIKLQAAQTVGFNDPSGNDYDLEGMNNIIATRFAPEGGWNTTGLDFANPSTKVSKNRANAFDDIGAISFYRLYIVADEDTVLLLSKNTEGTGGHGVQTFQDIQYIGETTPKGGTQGDSFRVMICTRLGVAGSSLNMQNFRNVLSVDPDLWMFNPTTSNFEQFLYRNERFYDFATPYGYAIRSTDPPTIPLFPMRVRTYSVAAGLVTDVAELRLVATGPFYPGAGSLQIADQTWMPLENNVRAAESLWIAWDGNSVILP